MSVPPGPAIGLIELCSIARGVRVVDVMVKKAPVVIRRACPVHPGKFLILMQGGVDEVNEALRAGEHASAEALIDSLNLPSPHDQLSGLIDAAAIPLGADAIGVLEAFSVAAIVRAADAALKAAKIIGVRLRLADGLGGKGYFLFSGVQHDVEEGLAHGRAAIGAGLLAGDELIANPHPEMIAALAR